MLPAKLMQQGVDGSHCRLKEDLGAQQMLEAMAELCKSLKDNDVVRDQSQVGVPAVLSCSSHRSTA